MLLECAAQEDNHLHHADVQQETWTSTQPEHPAQTVHTRAKRRVGTNLDALPAVPHHPGKVLADDCFLERNDDHHLIKEYLFWDSGIPKILLFLCPNIFSM